MRYLSSVSKSLSTVTSSARRRPIQISLAESEKTPLTDTSDQDQATVTVIQGPLPTPNLKIKKVDHFYSRWSKKWKYQNSGSHAIPEAMAPPEEGKDDPWQQFCLVVVREIPQTGDDPYFQIVVKSQYLLKACKDVIAEVQGVSWNAVPLQLDPKLFLTFLPQFQTYRDELRAKEKATEEDVHVVTTVDVLIDYLRKDYRATIASIENLSSHGEITFDLLYAVLVPRTIMITTNPVTKEPQALQLAMVHLISLGSGMPAYELILEGIDVDDATMNIKAFARIQTRMLVTAFKGTIKITTLDAYPIQYHPHEAKIRETLLARGRKWTSLAHGTHHMYYNGTGAFRRDCKIIKYNLDSRVMIDRGNFKKFNPNYPYPAYKSGIQVPSVIPEPSSRMEGGSWPNLVSSKRRSRSRTSIRTNSNNWNIPLHENDNEKWERMELTDEELLIASPILYSFSLADKLWLELNVEKIVEIVWNEEAFSNLVLPSDRKTLLQSLVEAHNAEMDFDDFIKGKGRGLVVNLFGPPGVGKTLSAEATSEHVKRPLYVVGAGDLGTSAAALDQELQRVFELATTWKAIVLIDEADVFLEQRSLHDLERNAMVAVFLRHLEYYPAILFLTTNRVKTFDEAILSRIHIALHFHNLSTEARRSVWTAFLAKAGVKIGPDGGISAVELNKLTERDINGRQVKNATRTASSLAVSRGETLRYKHLTEVLDVMDKFSVEFQNMRKE